MNNIKIVVFDLGGVVLNINYNLTAQAFNQLGTPHFEKLFSQQNQQNLFDNIETGHITPQYFINEIQQQCTPGTTLQQVTDAWNALLLNYEAPKIKCVQEVAKKYTTALLSNTNSIHETAYNKILQTQTGFNTISQLFTHTYLSHQIGRRKPHVATFNWVAQALAAEPSSILFFDDSIQHIEGATKAGWQAHLITKEKDILYYTQQLNLLS
jgi:putative hydrolase of the HAD superfamily